MGINKSGLVSLVKYFTAKNGLVLSISRAAVVDLKWADDDFVRPKYLRASLSLS